MIAFLSLIDLAGIVVVGGVILVAVLRRAHLQASIGKVQLSVDDGAALAATAARKAEEAAEKVEAVNLAVNNRPAGDPTLYEQVRAQGLALDNATQATHATARKVDQLAILVTKHIAQHEADAGR